MRYQSPDDWLVAWINTDADRARELDSLPGVLQHVSDAWARRAEPNVLLVHYDDLSTDARDHARTVALSPRDMLAWLHRDASQPAAEESGSEPS